MIEFNIGTIVSRTIRISFIYAFILNFILFVSIVSGRPNDGELSYEPTVKSHPVVYYKEDYVNEDYAVEKNTKELSETNEKLEKLKMVKNSTDKLQKPEKVMFDFYPIENSNFKQVKINDNINVKILSLYDDPIENKRKYRHKKYNHNRMKRDVKSLDSKKSVSADPIYGIFDTSFPNPKVVEDSSIHHIKRRNYNSYGTPNAIRNVGNQIFTVSSQYPVQAAPIKYAIRGNYYNPFPPGAIAQSNLTNVFLNNRFGEDDDNKDRFLWVVNYPSAQSVRRPQTPSINQVTPRPGRRPPPPLIHDSKPNQVPQRTTRRPTSNTQRPQDFENQGTISETIPTRRPAPPLIHDSSPNRDRENVRPEITTAAPPSSSPGEQRSELPKCVWAIVSCCKRRNLEIRYNCFEQNGCSGAFWDLNPCADNVQEVAFNAADQYFGEF